jgi:hypothetical protein
MIEHERQRRKELWDSLIASGGPREVSPLLLRELGIYGGASGIWVDKNRTGQVTHDGLGIAVGLLHTGEHYPDSLTEHFITYHYPETSRPASRDYNEIEATKNAHQLFLPVFVVTSSIQHTKKRDVRLGWVDAWNDYRKVFHVVFIQEVPKELLAQPDSEETFIAQEEGFNRRAATKIRPGQQRFGFLVFQRYGEKCAVCDIDLPDLLDAAHIIPKGQNGTDDPRNGIVLCAIHHRALDAGLFHIDPNSLKIYYNDSGPNANMLRITRDDLHHLKALPHPIALSWLLDHNK